MIDDITAVLLAVTVILAPLWIILHYLSKMRGNRRISAAEDAAYAQLNQTATRMEHRMATLERILDAEVPDWRRNADIGTS